MLNIFHTGIENLNPRTIGLLAELQLSWVNGLVIQYYDAWSAGPHTSHDTRLIKVNILPVVMFIL